MQVAMMYNVCNDSIIHKSLDGDFRHPFVFIIKMIRRTGLPYLSLVD